MIIKDSCEDFLVDEIPLNDLCSDEGGQYHVYLLKKTNYTTERALTHIAQSLRIPRRQISFAGTKDKHAITTQHITISGVKKEHVEGLTLKDIELIFIGYRKDRLALGELKGNRFSLLVKQVDMIKDVPQSFYVPNYFDEQRFSSHNTQLGMLILKKKYKEAIDIIVEVDTDYSQSFQDHLARQKNDYIGALRLLPRKTLLFYVHAVQSYFFNEQLKEHISSLGDTFEVTYSEGTFLFPQELLQDIEFKEGELIGYQSTQGMGGIEPYDFINKSLPELSLDGGKRPLYSFVQDCKLTREETGVRVEFTLGKGSYATIVLKQLFGKL